MLGGHARFSPRPRAWVLSGQGHTPAAHRSDRLPIASPSPASTLGSGRHPAGRAHTRSNSSAGVERRPGVGGLMAATTTNPNLRRWVDEWAEIFSPDAVEWCDGSDEEYQRFCQLL